MTVVLSEQSAACALLALEASVYLSGSESLATLPMVVEAREELQAAVPIDDRRTVGDAWRRAARS